MNDDELMKLNARTSMSMFTFYLDDMTKLTVVSRLNDILPGAKKGTISALIRVLLREWSELPPDGQEAYKDKIEKEYLFTTKKNKRSSL